MEQITQQSYLPKAQAFGEDGGVADIREIPVKMFKEGTRSPFCMEQITQQSYLPKAQAFGEDGGVADIREIPVISSKEKKRAKGSFS